MCLIDLGSKEIVLVERRRFLVNGIEFELEAAYLREPTDEGNLINHLMYLRLPRNSSYSGHYRFIKTIPDIVVSNRLGNIIERAIILFNFASSKIPDISCFFPCRDLTKDLSKSSTKDGTFLQRELARLEKEMRHVTWPNNIEDRPDYHAVENEFDELNKHLMR